MYYKVKTSANERLRNLLPLWITKSNKTLCLQHRSRMSFLQFTTVKILWWRSSDDKEAKILQLVVPICTLIRKLQSIHNNWSTEIISKPDNSSSFPFSQYCTVKYCTVFELISQQTQLHNEKNGTYKNLQWQTHSSKDITNQIPQQTHAGMQHGTGRYGENSFQIATYIQFAKLTTSTMQIANTITSTHKVVIWAFRKKFKHYIQKRSYSLLYGTATKTLNTITSICMMACW